MPSLKTPTVCDTQHAPKNSDAHHPQRTSERIRTVATNTPLSATHTPSDRMLPDSAWRQSTAFDSLTLTSCVRDLPLHEASIDALEPGRKLHELFGADLELPGVIVLEEGQLAGLISREYFFELLGRPFGVEVYMNRPVLAMLDSKSTAPLVLDASRTISSATRSALERPGMVAYEPIVIFFNDTCYRMLNTRVLVLAQSRLLSLSHSEIRNQLQEAADFVHSLLPAPMKHENVACDWLFVPSEQLGGDAFGYRWLDESHMAIYLLDVSGHGTGPAFLSVSALNVLQNRSGGSDIDFYKPETVLTRLNQMFFGIRKRKKGRMFITIWYGVYDTESRQLTYASAGHPPAFLFSADGSHVRNLRTPNLALGIRKDCQYGSDHTQIHTLDRLFVYSDGAYEVMMRDHRLWTMEEFRQVTAHYVKTGCRDLPLLEREIRRQSISPKLPDDLSLLEVRFA